jgi:hypothetical protein
LGRLFNARHLGYLLAVERRRRAIVEVRRGPLAARKFILEPERSLRVGRSNVVDLPVPHDGSMSANHFSLAWDGERCTLRDLAGAGGTWLQGLRIAEADVASGSWIKAGATDFMVYLEAHTPPPRRTVAPSGHAARAEAALAELQRRTEPLFAVVDASRGPRPLRLLREAVDDCQSLYEGLPGDVLANEAPYLVALRRDSGLLERLLREGWGSRWGIFLASARPLKDVRRHLRRFLLVQDDETNRPYYFRFYDPRTLRIFVPTCTPHQRADFFGDIAAFFAEDESGSLRAFVR